MEDNQVEDTDRIIKSLDLKPHIEGGYYKRTWQSEISIDQSNLQKNFKSTHCLASNILYLLKSSEFSALHSLNSEELWTFISGISLKLHLFNPDNKYQQVIIGTNFINGEVPQFSIKAGTVFAAEPNTDMGYSLVSCFVCPEFKDEDFVFAEANDLIIRFPNQKELILKLIKKK